MEEYIITRTQAKERGVNLDMLDMCRQIRKLAQLDRITLDESVHRDNPYNKHLFSYIEYCELEPLDYIKGYLSNLQPYMISRFPSQEKTDKVLCILDNAYRISLYIKIDKKKGNEVIVSFHENNKKGIAKENNLITNVSGGKSEIVPVFGEPTGSRIDGSPKEEIKLFVQRGMLVFPIRVMAQLCEGNIYLTERNDIENPIIEECNQYLRDLYTSNVDLATLDQVELFSVLQQISFTSYDNTIFSNLTLLVDNMEIQRGIPSRKAADFALTTYIDHLYLTKEQAEELIALLEDKYVVDSTKNIRALLDHIEDKLLAVADEPEVIITQQE